ncbi:hypothetical protein PVL29_012717 [Vitis rotundifolia]|uniref:Uncharacterized protein n=1 Tax=Vitis rotundifolia TaxID=103349 RepID=A0AA38ZJG1_VITRO|nr:hypothetical protein PVL29_012717 [Vitis rotundifolia]
MKKDPLIHIACSCVGSIAEIVQCSPIFGAFAVSHGKIRNGEPTDSLLVGSIDHNDAYIDLYYVMTLTRSSPSYFMFSPIFRTLKKPKPQRSGQIFPC